MEHLNIGNSTLLTDHFGYWPDFHDSEIMEMSFYRNYPDQPIIKVKIYAFEMTNKLVGRYFKLIKQCIVDFEFIGVRENSFEDFSFQNALNDLIIERIEGLYEVEFNGASGVDGYLTFEGINIVSLVPIPHDPKKG